MRATDREIVERNVAAYARHHRRYERRHPEIFNAREQARCRRVLELAVDAATRDSDSGVALDVGCGSGNLEHHLLELGMNVTAADVSPHFLRAVERRFGPDPRLRALRINGRDLGALDDRSFDLVATYSVLHHVPNYLAMVTEMLRVLKPGGVIYIDHEANEDFWDPPEALGDFWEELSEAARQRRPGWDPEAMRWQRFLMPSKYAAAFHRVIGPRLPASWRRGWLDPRYQAEGDIHVWVNDHIEWAKIFQILRSAGAELLLEEEYLVYRRHYPVEIYDRYRDRAADMKVVVARKPGAG